MPCPRGQEGECFKRTRSPPFRGGNGKSEALWPDGLAGRHVQEEAAWGPTRSRQLRPRVGWPLPAAGFAAVAQSPEASLVPWSRRPDSRGRAALPEQPPPADAVSQLRVCLPPCDTQRGTGDHVQGAPRDECHTGTCDLPLPRSVGTWWPLRTRRSLLSSVPQSPAGPGQPRLRGSPSSSVPGHPCPVNHRCHQADKPYTLG